MSRIIPIQVDPDFKPPERRPFNKPVHDLPRQSSFSDEDDDFFTSEFTKKTEQGGAPRRRASAPSRSRVFERTLSGFDHKFDDDTERLFRRRGFEDDLTRDAKFWEPAFHSRTRKTNPNGSSTVRSYSVVEEPLGGRRRLGRIDSDEFDDYVKDLLGDDNLDREFSDLSRVKRRDSGEEEVFSKEKGTKVKVGRPSWSGTGSVEIPVHFVRKISEEEDDGDEKATEGNKHKFNEVEKKDEETETEDLETKIIVEKEENEDELKNAHLTCEEATQTELEKETKSEAKTEMKAEPKSESAEISKIRSVEKQLESLQAEVQNIEAERNAGDDNKGYLRLEELLTRCIIDLDTIEANGNEMIRCARRSVVNRVQDALDQLERKGSKSAKNNNVSTAARP